MLRDVGGGPDTPILSRKGLIKWVRAEFAVFLIYLRYVLRCKHKQAKGNQFAQGIHDGGTLDNKQKYQALGLQFIDELWRRNWVICIAMTPCFDGTDAAVAKLLDEKCEERTLFDIKTLAAMVISDRAARGVAAHLEVDEECCLMHDGDKLGSSAVGALVRSKNKKPVNPFPEGVALMKKAHDMGVYFSYGTRWSELMTMNKSIGSHVPQIKIGLDLNKTRVQHRAGTSGRHLDVIARPDVIQTIALGRGPSTMLRPDAV